MRQVTKMAYNAMKMVCTTRIASIGSASEASSHSFSPISAIARNNDRLTLPSTDTARSKTR